MGNLISAQESQQLDKLGNLTLPANALFNIIFGVFIIVLGIAMLKQMRKDSRRQTALGTITNVHCPAKNFCLIDLALQESGSTLTAVPVQGVWTLTPGETLWVSFEMGSQGPVQGSGTIVLEPASAQKAGKKEPTMLFIVWMPLVFGFILLAQGVIKLVGKNYSSARKLNSAGFFAGL